MFLTAQLTAAARESGQDRVLVFHSSPRVVLAVADGVGGRAGGAEAAEHAIAFFRDRAAPARARRDCEELLFELDDLLEKDPVAGESTGVLTIVDETGVFGASVGDSGAWVVNARGIDHLTRYQIRHPMLGTGSARPIGFKRPAFNGTLLLATDGLLKYAAPERIATALQGADLDVVAANLVALVRYPSGALPDDVGIALCRLHQP
jgi:PPM family protein phosphatase